MLRKSYLLLLQCVLIRYITCELTLLFGAAAAIGTAIYYGKCYVTECCNDDYIPADFYKLQLLLHQNVYGQHIAESIVVNALKSHWNNPYVQKPLTLSFHGLPGTGKNYVTKFIQDSLFKEGAKSKYVHHFIGRLHFPLQSNVHDYQTNIHNWIKGNVTECEKQLFIFDEVDKMPLKLLNIMKPFIDYHERLEKVDYRKCIFIFLSNTGSSAIMEEYHRLWQQGIKREDIKLNSFEKLIVNGAFNEQGGFKHSDNIKSNLIDHYVPFLPLQLEHVEKCIRNQFQKRNFTATEDHIEAVLNYVNWGPSPHNLFSTAGCKRIDQLVAAVIVEGVNFKTTFRWKNVYKYFSDISNFFFRLIN